MSAEAIWILAERLSGEHIAQLYSHDSVLVESLRMFTIRGVSRGEAVLLVLTPSHRDLLLADLRAEGFDVGALQHAGRLLLLDAAEALDSVMLDGTPVATLFRTSVGKTIDRMTCGGKRSIRVFGEMVDLLWKSNRPAAIRLEQMWSELVVDSADLSLFCGYSMGEECEAVPEALRAAHSRIITSALAECSGNAIVGHTVDSRIVYWNRGAERIYGYAPDEAMGQPGSMLAPPGENELPGVIERIRRGAQVQRYETRRLGKDGTVITVSAVVSPISTRDGEVIGISVDGRDISERKRTEEALLALAAVVDSSEDAIIWNTPDATILTWNRGAERIYGYAAAEVIGRPFSILLPAGSADEVSSIGARIRRGEKVEYRETKHQRKDGAIVDVSLTVAPVKTPGGDTLGVFALARDLTERKQAEAARLKMARLDQVQAARRPLLERVFESQEQERRRIARELHDQAGQLMTSLLVGLRALDDSTTVDAMKAQAQRLRAITAQAIDEVGRLARGLHSSLPDDHGLGVALQRYAADYSTTHHIAVDLTLHESDLIDLPPDVQLAVFRIVQEALTNVARHSAATAIRIRVTRSGTRLETTIADNGAGFEADAKEVDPEAHLGLQSMRERAAILGGTVRLTSGSTGTTVLVQLPTEKRDPKAS